MEEPGPRFVAAFVRSVALLALEADAQLAWLGQGGLSSADELALEFDDGFRLAPIFMERGWLSDRALPELAELDEMLDAMSGEHNASLWSTEALASRAEWDRVRALARSALVLMA